MNIERESYEVGLKIGEFYKNHNKDGALRTILMQMTSGNASKDFKMQKIMEICVGAQLPVPSNVIDSITGNSDDVDYFTFIAGLNNAIAVK